VTQAAILEPEAEPAVLDAEADPRPRPRRRPSPTWRLLAVYAASRLVILAAAFAVAMAHSWLSVTAFLTRWDANWYLVVARHGYPATVPEVGGRAIQSTIAFFPLYPLSVRLADLLLPLSLPVVGIVVSLAFGAVSVVLVHRLACAVTDPDTAWRAAVLYCVFPGAFILSMAYSEALMLALAAGCLLMLLRGRWLAAGVLAALATACRPTGVALVAACAWQAGLAIEQRREWRAAVAPLVAPAGLVAFFGFLWLRTGDALAWFRVEQDGWGGQGSGRLPPTLRIIGRFLMSPLGAGTAAIVVISVVFTVAMVVILVRDRWPSVLIVYSLAVVGITALTRNDGLRPRDVFTAFPLVFGLASVTRGRAFRTVSVGCAWAMVISLVAHNMGFWAQP
jgi:hypothetical protein